MTPADTDALRRAAQVLLKWQDPDSVQVADPPSFSDALHAMRAVLSGRTDLALILISGHEDGAIYTREQAEKMERAYNEVCGLPEWRDWTGSVQST